MWLCTPKQTLNCNVKLPREKILKRSCRAGNQSHMVLMAGMLFPHNPSNEANDFEMIILHWIIIIKKKSKIWLSSIKCFASKNKQKETRQNSWNCKLILFIKAAEYLILAQNFHWFTWNERNFKMPYFYIQIDISHINIWRLLKLKASTFDNLKMRPSNQPLGSIVPLNSPRPAVSEALHLFQAPLDFSRLSWRLKMTAPTGAHRAASSIKFRRDSKSTCLFLAPFQ